MQPPLRATTASPVQPSDEITAKSITNDILSFFQDRDRPTMEKDTVFANRLNSTEVSSKLDGLHMITLLYNCARARRRASVFIDIETIVNKIEVWDREWNERDISYFMYGINSLDCVNDIDGKLLKLAANKIEASSSVLASRGIGNALYGLQGITTDTIGAPELCQALAEKVGKFEGDLNGQDIGIGIYGLQGMSSDWTEVRGLVKVLSEKIEQSETEMDSQALGNALYGLQSMNSIHDEVRGLALSLAKLLGESAPTLSIQSIGAALYGLQKMTSESLEVRALLAALSEKIEASVVTLDAQAVGNALFGLQKMSSDSAEVRYLVQAITGKLMKCGDECGVEELVIDSKGIGSALYGLHSMSSDSPQIRALLTALAERIELSSNVYLSGQDIADAMYGISSMTSETKEVRRLLAALSARIEANKGKLDPQDLSNCLFGLQGLSSDIQEVRLIVSKIAEKVKRSKTPLRSQHISKALMGFRCFDAESPEVKSLVKQMTIRIKESDRTKMTAQAIADSLYGLQGMTSNVTEVQSLLGELAKKIAITAAELSPTQVGRALGGLQGISNEVSIFAEISPLAGVYGDTDEAQFLLSALWDKIKNVKAQMPLKSIADGLLGITFLKDPVGINIRNYLYAQCIRLGAEFNADTAEKADIVNAVKALRVNNLQIPKWLAQLYIPIEESHSNKPVILASKGDKLIAQRLKIKCPDMEFAANSVIDGVQLDLNFPSLLLNIELDSARHLYPAQRRQDMSRDEFLTVTKKYEVLRLDTTGKNVDQMVEQIEKIYSKRKELSDIQSVQQLYSRQEDVQRIYVDKGRGDLL